MNEVVDTRRCIWSGCVSYRRKAMVQLAGMHGLFARRNDRDVFLHVFAGQGHPVLLVVDRPFFGRAVRLGLPAAWAEIDRAEHAFGLYVDGAGEVFYQAKRALSIAAAENV